MTRTRIVPYLPRLFGYAFSLTLDRDMAGDLVQDCALRALGAERVPADEAAFRAWLFRILRNAFFDQRRRTARRGTTSIEDGEMKTDAPVWRHDDSLINAITVRNGLRRLSPAYREIVALVDISGFSYAEAARLLDIPSGTVMSRLSRARRALLDALAEDNVHALPRAARRRAR